MGSMLYSGAELTTEEFMVPALDRGIALYVRNKRPAKLRAFRPERTVLFVHGATYPAHSTFDLQLGGLSWMDYIAGHGYDVYLFDIRGYGKSTRPPEMAAPAAANPPIVRTATAVKDIAAVVDFILARRSLPHLVLLGWSWGTFSTPAFLTEHPGKVGRLVLYSPIWIGQTGRLVQSLSSKLGAYRTVTRDQARERWFAGVPAEKKSTLIPAEFFDAFLAKTFASDPAGGAMQPPVIRAPNGVVQDCIETWWAGKPYYDPASITVPTLLITAAFDNDVPPSMARALFPLLINSPGKRLVELAEGTHSVMMEAKRFALFKAVQAFLDAPQIA
jgi:pimeloyl-ACP methyl ester carboxylesterase